MKSRNLIHRSSLACVAFTCAAWLLGGTAAFAADGTQGTRAITVHYADVDMSTIGGATTLYHRIRGAARLACGDVGRRLDEQRDWDICYRSALDAAVSEVDSALLTTVHRQQNGDSPVTAMLSR